MDRLYQVPRQTVYLYQVLATFGETQCQIVRDVDLRRFPELITLDQNHIRVLLYQVLLLLYYSRV